MAHSTLRKKNSYNTPKTPKNHLSMGPRANTIQLILGYSRALRVVDAPPVGKIDIVLN
ncbi:MAG: hypothetical protein KA408_12385 [Flavobacteriales bacterium]|nr:hypothetical protein [Flavobacteriales bacterium]